MASWGLVSDGEGMGRITETLRVVVFVLMRWTTATSFPARPYDWRDVRDIWQTGLRRRPSPTIVCRTARRSPDANLVQA